MDDYGSITIDNQNLLSDLLGLESNENNDALTLYQPRSQIQDQRQNQNNQNNFLPFQGRKILLESPTFTKKEDDIYRYVHSRISNVDTSVSRAQHLQDSLDPNENINKRNVFVNNNQRIDEYQIPANEPQRRIGSNTLLSDLAVASLANREFSQTQAFRQNNLNENNLLDSLDTNNQFLGNNQKIEFYLDNPNKQTQQQFSQPFTDNKFILHQQQQQQQQPQQPVIPPLQLQPQQFQSVFQAQPGVILLSPSSNQIPLINSSIPFNPQAPQFIPVAFQQPQLLSQQANMFYQEPMQPIFYNTTYPLNLPLQNSNNYYNQVEDYSNGPYQNYQIFENRNISQNGIQNATGSRFDAQPLQPPPVPQPRLNHNNKILSQQSNDSHDMDSPDSEDNGDLVNEFNQLKVNNNDYDENDSKSQEVWTKLQKNRELKTSSKGKKKPASSSNIPSVGSIKPLSKKPPLPENNSNNNINKTNYLERNIEAIRNKENLTHRYPEKKYEVVHGKNVNERVKTMNGDSSSKKPPHHLKPIENYNEEENLQLDQYQYQSQSENIYNPNKKISIPIDPSKYKDQDHINLDINLRLVDFLPQNQNRTLDDFDVNNDPLARYIRNYETNISRSLPGSSGSLNKNKPLPPLKRLQKPISHQGGRLQHEYDNEIRSEEGYLAQLQRAHTRPAIKTYTIKDYRNFKKDALLTGSNNNTGKLGFDYDNDDYKQKIEIVQKKNDYAERVKLRNQILISEQKKNEDNNSTRSPNQQPIQSKNQRAKEYVKNNVIRQKSASKNEDENDSKQNFTVIKEKKRTPITQTSETQNTKPLNSQPDQRQAQKLDLNKSKKQDDTAIVRIRDPVTSRVRTIFLNDSQIEELSKRHEQDKQKVNNLITNKSTTNNFQKVEKPRQPIDIKDRKQLIENVEEKPIVQQKEKEIDVIIYDKPKKVKESINNDENFEKLIQRHKNEKKIVNDFDASPYLNDDLQQIQENLNFRNTNEIKVE